MYVYKHLAMMLSRVWAHAIILSPIFAMDAQLFIPHSNHITKKTDQRLLYSNFACIFIVISNGLLFKQKYCMAYIVMSSNNCGRGFSPGSLLSNNYMMAKCNV